MVALTAAPLLLKPKPTLGRSGLELNGLDCATPEGFCGLLPPLELPAPLPLPPEPPLLPPLPPPEFALDPELLSLPPPGPELSSSCLLWLL
jgi:hypothetical protein